MVLAAVPKSRYFPIFERRGRRWSLKERVDISEQVGMRRAWRFPESDDMALAGDCLAATNLEGLRWPFPVQALRCVNAV